MSFTSSPYILSTLWGTTKFWTLWKLVFRMLAYVCRSCIWQAEATLWQPWIVLWLVEEHRCAEVCQFWFTKHSFPDINLMTQFLSIYRVGLSTSFSWFRHASFSIFLSSLWFIIFIFFLLYFMIFVFVFFFVSVFFLVNSFSPSLSISIFSYLHMYVSFYLISYLLLLLFAYVFFRQQLPFKQILKWFPPGIRRIWRLDVR